MVASQISVNRRLSAKTEIDHRDQGSALPWILALSLCIVLGYPATSAAQVYSNPILGDPGHVDREIADPFVLKWNGEYYLYSSGDPILAWHSSDLVHWDSIGQVLSASSAPEAWNQADVWAPEVVYRNGKF